MKYKVIHFVGAVLSFVPLLLLGCGGGNQAATIEVSGKVTFDDEPFSEGMIWFSCIRSGAEFSARPGPDGRYTLIIQDVHKAEKFGIYISGVDLGEDAVDATGAPKPTQPPPIPVKYLEYTTSGLTATIDLETNNTFDFALNSE